MRVLAVDGHRTAERPLLGVLAAGWLRLPVLRWFRYRERRYRREGDGGGRARGVGGRVRALLQWTAQDRIGRSLVGRLLDRGCGSGGGVVGVRDGLDLLRYRRRTPQGCLPVTVTGYDFGLV